MRPKQRKPGLQFGFQRPDRTDTWRMVTITFSTSLYTYWNSRQTRTENSHLSHEACFYCFEICIFFSFLYWVFPISLTSKIRVYFCISWILLELNQNLHSFVSDLKHAAGRRHLRGPRPLPHRAGRAGATKMSKYMVERWEIMRSRMVWVQQREAELESKEYPN